MCSIIKVIFEKAGNVINMATNLVKMGVVAGVIERIMR